MYIRAINDNLFDISFVVLIFDSLHFLRGAFRRIQGLGLAESGAVLKYCEHFGPAR